MLPTLDELQALPPELLHEFIALTLNPASLAVIVRLVELGIIEQAVADGGTSLAALGDRDPEPQTDRHERAAVSLEMALELGAGLGLLTVLDGRVHATALSATFLASGSRLRLLGHVEHYASYLPAAAAIGRALVSTRRSRRSMWSTGRPREEHDGYFAARQAYNESRRAYFWDSSYLLLRAHLRRTLCGHRRVCDVGAGPAGFAALLAKCFPSLHVCAVEANLAHDDYRRRTEQALRAEGVEVELLGTNALLDPLPPGLDLVTFNRLLSGVPRDGVDAWLQRAYEGLVGGGVLAAVDYAMTGDPAHDRAVALVVAHWMGKDCHVLAKSPPSDPHDDKHQWGWSRPWHAQELCEALRRAGFQHVGFAPADGPFTLIHGTRP
ncbi:class I SAM-dependent methyltransferase [Paraliomyxa miuraensis]|uniref:class I SAM-dependent methyltransferase n=1 Tax=Paraliomyxa miuraensis TaxID=376150 RepID=UPI00225307C4|nr:class I SAM-dependent methyltransferase [Paraliomyxa miuraensis]MCX4243104.1 class I SAM-dependent methyltransferase [Paraliomyxa miuraensis]